MTRKLSALWWSACILLSAADTVQIRTTDGRVVEADAKVRAVKVGGREILLVRIASIHSATPASDAEKARIDADLAAVQGADRRARDLAVEELTAIGLPVMAPLLKVYKDTDQHEPRPLYRLFERIIPSNADGFDRSQSLIRLTSGQVLRGALPASGEIGGVAWTQMRALAVRQKRVSRAAMQAHSLRHSTQIEYLDTGVSLTASSRVEIGARGFARLSWDADGWASDPNGLTKPGSPAYKSNLWDGQPFGVLVGRMGAGGDVFFVGKQLSKAGLAAGRLMLAVNDNRHWQNNLGTYTATLTATDAYDWGAAQ
ncbi:MAG: hypothetical protein FJW31_03135 [Acidobacteria bacterium]|nr:hypothetical protein [Acidobacteriota bacterium]